MSPLYWLAALQLDHIKGNMESVLFCIRYERHLPMLFAITQAYYRLKVVYATSGLEEYYENWHDNKDEYQSIPGMDKFSEIRSQKLFHIRYRAEELSDYVTDITDEMMSIAQAGQIKEQSE